MLPDSSQGHALLNIKDCSFIPDLLHNSHSCNAWHPITMVTPNCVISELWLTVTTLFLLYLETENVNISFKVGHNITLTLICAFIEYTMHILRYVSNADSLVSCAESFFYFQWHSQEHFQLKALCMIVDTPWYVPNTVIRRDLQTATVTEEIRHCSPQRTSKCKPHWATWQQAIVKTPTKWSAYQISSVTVVFVILVFKV
jgi:hypothetical protein